MDSRSRAIQKDIWPSGIMMADSTMPTNLDGNYNDKIAIATERTPLIHQKAPGSKQPEDENQVYSDTTKPIGWLFGTSSRSAVVVVALLLLVGGASCLWWYITNNTASTRHSRSAVPPQTIIIVAEDEANDEYTTMYHTTCRYYSRTTKQQQQHGAVTPPRILQTSMSVAGQPWSWLDCEEVPSSSNVELNSARAPDAILQVNFTTTCSDESTTTAASSPTILGFGGAFTEASALNFQRLSPSGQTMVLDLLFSKQGLGYSLGRIPIDSCDFSVSSYNFDSVEDDVNLDYFDDSVQHDVDNGMIPFIQRAMAVYSASYRTNEASSSSLQLFGSPWSPPAWMKRPTTFDPPGVLHALEMTHSKEPTCLRGSLRGGADDDDDSKYAAAWAHYIAKWIQAYETNHNITISAVTVQNEPEFPAPWEACSYSATNMTDFVAYHLGPRLNGTSTQIWAFDHNKDHVNTWMQVMLNGTGKEDNSSPLARKYVKGTAYHWYAGGMDRLLDGALGIANLHRLRADLKALGLTDHIVLGTEACHCPSTGYAGGDISIYWSRAERYAHTILADLAAGSQGWVDWNLILDSIGGPNHLGNLCDASMLSVPHRAANATEDISPLPDFEYHPPVSGKIVGDNRTREELNAIGFPAQFMDQGIAVQPIYHYMGHISRYVRPGSRSIPALIHASLGMGEIFRPHGATVAGGGENDLARDGIELLAWPCEGSTRQQFRWNPRVGTISVAGHSWLGDPTVSCIGAQNDKDFLGVRLVDCTKSTKSAGIFDPQSIAGDPYERVIIRVRNGADAGKCLSLLELANGGGSYGPLGGAQVALGHCSAEASKWIVDLKLGTAKSLYFWNKNNSNNEEEANESEEVTLSRTVCMTTGWPFLQMGAFHTPNGTSPHTIVILNEAKDPANYAVTTGDAGVVVLTGSIPSRSIQTILLDQR